MSEYYRKYPQFRPVEIRMHDRDEADRKGREFVEQAGQIIGPTLILETALSPSDMLELAHFQDEHREQLQAVTKERNEFKAKLETLTARSEDFTGAMRELTRERDELRERHARLLSRMRDLRAELSGDVYRMPRMRIYRAIKADESETK